MSECEHLSAAQVIAAVNAGGVSMSYRQLNVWTTAGYFDNAHRHVGGRTVLLAGPSERSRLGSGYPVFYEPGTPARLALVAALVASPAQVAVRAAFHLAEHRVLELAGGHLLRLEPAA